MTRIGPHEISIKNKQTRSEILAEMKINFCSSEWIFIHSGFATFREVADWSSAELKLILKFWTLGLSCIFVFFEKFDVNKYISATYNELKNWVHLTNCLILLTWQETEKKHNFQRHFVVHEQLDSDFKGADKFSKFESHNKNLYSTVVSPEVQPTSKACVRWKSLSKHKKK